MDPAHDRYVHCLSSSWGNPLIPATGWGFFVANWVGYGCGFLKGQAQWRVPLAIQIVPAVFLLL